MPIRSMTAARTRSIQHLPRVAVATLGLTASALWGSAMAVDLLAPDVASALDAAPANAELVVLIPSMQQASNAVADLAEFFEANEPEMLDLLGSFKDEMGLNAGLDDDGSAVIVISGIAQAIEQGEEPGLTVLLPVDDYAAFVESIGGTDGGVTEVTLDRSANFAKQIEGYAVISEDRAIVEAYAAANAGDALLDRVGKYAADSAGDALVATFFDVAALREPLLQAIDMGMEQMGNEMRREMQGEQLPFDAEMVVKLVTTYGDLGKVILEGVDAAMFTATSDGDGVRGGYAWNTVEGSTLATYLTAERTEFAGLLSQMPNSPYIFATAMDTTAIDLGLMTNDLMTKVGDVVGDEQMFAGIVEMIKQSVGMYDDMHSAAQVYYAPDMAAIMGGGFMKSLSVYQTENPEESIAAWKASIEKMPGMIPQMMEAMGVADQPGTNMDFEVEWTDNAINLNGVNVSQYQINMILPPEVVGEMGPAAMFMGNAGTGGYVATVGDKVLMTTVPDAQLMSQGLATLDAGDGLGSLGTVEGAREALPDGAVMEAFLSLDGIATAANPFLMMFAGGMQIEVPADLAPISMGIGLDGSAMGATWVVPMDVMTFVKDTAQQLEAAQGGPGGGGGGGGQRAPY